MDKMYFSVMAIGEDTPGIVAAVTGVLSERHGCSVEASQMMIVGGHFAITLIGSSQTVLDCGKLEGDLAEAGSRTGISRVDVSELNGFEPTGARGPSYSIEAEVGDRTGVLHEIAKALADHHVNITSLSSDCSPESASRCRMYLDVSLPTDMRLERLKGILFDSVAKDVQFRYRSERTDQSSE